MINEAGREVSVARDVLTRGPSDTNEKSATFGFSKQLPLKDLPPGAICCGSTLSFAGETGEESAVKKETVFRRSTPFQQGESALKCLGIVVMNLTRLLPAAMAGIVFSATVVSGQRETSAPAPSPAASTASHAGLVEKSCVSCHNNKTKTAGLSLQDLSLTDVPAHGEIWEKVLLKVRSGEMPPPTVRTRPDPAASAAFASFLEKTLDAAATTKPNPGRAPVHRLNRAEYSNAIRDLLAVDVKPGAWLPVDDSGYGFDNIAAVLSTSPALIERYMTAARRISRLAVGDVTLKPVEDIYDAKRDPLKGTRNERVSDYLPFDSRAGISIQHYFPVDGEYVFKIRIPGLPVGENDPEIDPYQARIPVKAGLHWVGVTSPRENLKAESEGPGGRGGGAGGRGGGVPQVPFPVDLRLNGARVKRFDVPGGTPDIRQLVIGGPYGTSGRGVTASRSKIFTCDPKTAKEEPACAKTILTALARRAFRRPVTSADIQPLLAFYEKGRACPPKLQRRRAISTRGFNAPSRRCWSLLISCSASNRIPPSLKLRRASRA